MNKSQMFEPADYAHIIAQLGRLGAAVDKELDLINYRMMWIVVSESFIFSGFATAAVNYAPDRLFLNTVVVCLLVLLPLLGIFLVSIAMPAIKAAHSAVRRLKEQRDSFERRLPEHLRITLIAWNDRENWMGNLPPRFIPWAMLLIWSVLLCVVGWELFVRS
jgi:uncharacterized membrane protein YidH (DUF202 family)